MSLSSDGSDLGEIDIACTIDDASQVAEARRLATTMAARCRFDETEVGKIAIIATEAATNLVKHAGSGAIFIHGGMNRMDILAVDKGPGMRDAARCMEDGFSTSGSAGTGLGAVNRLSNLFEIFTNAECGCALLSRTGTTASSVRPWKVGGLCVPKRGEPECGDAWATEQTDDTLSLVMADGLGHGPIAATAAREAVRIFRANCGLEPAAILKRIHDALRSTRGAAVAVCRVTLATREVRFAGVGNISGTIVAGEQTRSMVSHNGTAGAEVRKIQEFTYPLAVGATVVVHSDGIATHWRLSEFPGLASRDPSLVAGVLFHHFQRGRDDATVVVLSES